MVEISENRARPDPFAVKDCALLAIATGKRARTLSSLSSAMENITTDSIYYHFWGGRLRPRFDDPEFQNDFAAWAFHALHDPVLAERLAIIDPSHYESLEHLRRDTAEIIDERLAEIETVPAASRDEQFVFTRSQIVVFDTSMRITDPKEFPEIISDLSTSSVYYHFIDARRRLPHGSDDFVAWMQNFNDEYSDLIDDLKEIEFYFCTLVELKQRLVEVFEKRLG